MGVQMKYEGAHRGCRKNAQGVRIRAPSVHGGAWDVHGLCKEHAQGRHRMCMGLY